MHRPSAAVFFSSPCSLNHYTSSIRMLTSVSLLTFIEVYHRLGRADLVNVIFKKSVLS